jgi:hypothetical protein
MTVYLFAYDLVNKPSEFDYEPLWAELKRLDGHRTQLSLWLLNLNNGAKEVVEHFRNFVHKDDRLWVTRVRKDDHWYDKAMAGTNDWLSRNPPS